MKYIHLGKSGKYTIVDDSDYEFLNQFKWSLSSNGYAVTYKYIPAINKSVFVRMHRVLMLLSSSSPTCTSLMVDHINNNKLDNRKSNLRICTKSLNEANKVRINNKTGYRGIYTYGEKFCAAISKDGNRYYLGVFESSKDAARAYNKKAEELYGEYASLNKIV